MSAAWWPKLRDRWIDTYARIGGGDPVEQLGRAVGGAVVDEHQLEVEVGDGRDGARDELLDELLLVEDGGDDDEEGGGAGWCCGIVLFSKARRGSAGTVDSYFYELLKPR